MQGINLGRKEPTWSFVKFPDFDKRAEWKISGDTLTDYRTFLEQHSGEEIDTWYWLRGDRFAQGVYIKDEAVAVMFRLKFDLT